MKFKVILADSPWQYSNKRTGGSLVSGADEKYNTLSLDELCNLSVEEIVDKNAVLFLWVTTPLKYEIAQSGLVEEWGFTYKTTIYWRKIMSLGLGFNFRGQVEECWMCTRGKVKPFRTQLPNIIQSKARKHSQKPEEFFQMIEPSLDKDKLNPRLEMFARTIRPGWYAIGNEITGNDIRIDLKKLISYDYLS
jgi:N6-adenosine-specific RNA methylase IME4